MGMSVERLAREVKELQRRLDALQRQRPAHDARGVFERQLMELEDELQEKQQDLAKAEACDERSGTGL